MFFNTSSPQHDLLCRSGEVKLHTFQSSFQHLSECVSVDCTKV